jgi:GcrA cell cycle regulator
MTVTAPPRAELTAKSAPTKARAQAAPFCWTETAEARLRQLWANGHSAAQIARAFGCVSRSAVVSKAQRLGLRRGAAAPQAKSISAVPRCATRGGERARAKQLLRRREGALAPQPEPMAASPASRACSLLELGRDTCRWPIGDPGTAGFHFCGVPPDGDHVYCPHHRGIAHERPDPFPGRAATPDGTQRRGAYSWHMAGAGYYREEAERHRGLAAAAPHSARARRWLQLAAEYKLLARSMEAPGRRSR